MFNIINQIKNNFYHKIKNDLINIQGKKMLMISFLVTSWISLWLSIGAQPVSLEQFGNSFLESINAIRIAIPLILSTITLIFLFYLIFRLKNFNQTFSIYLILYIYFFFQIIGLIFNNDVDFTLGNSYLILLALGSLNILFITNLLKFDFLKEIFFYSSILICFLFLIFFIFDNLKNLEEVIIASNFYSITKPNDLFMGIAYPRSTGLARIFAVVTIAIIIFNEEKSDLKFSFLNNFIIILFSAIIWGFQSRGAIICFYSTTIFLYLYFNYENKLKKFFLYLILPIILFYVFILASQYFIKIDTFAHQDQNNLNKTIIKESILPEIKETINEKEILENKKEILENKKEILENKKEILENKKVELQIRFVRHGLQTSGRKDIWIYSLKNYDIKKIFGYGSQGDRYLLGKKYEEYGNNSSNILLHSLLSGGYFAVLIILIIFFWFMLVLFKQTINFQKRINTYPNNLKISIALIFFFLVRGLIENSFSLFSIDYLLTLISIFIVDKNFRNIKNNC